MSTSRDENTWLGGPGSGRGLYVKDAIARRIASHEDLLLLMGRPRKAAFFGPSSRPTVEIDPLGEDPMRWAVGSVGHGRSEEA